jgi:hypothetical protein
MPKEAAMKVRTAQVYAASAAPATGTDFLKSQTRIVAQVRAREQAKAERDSKRPAHLMVTIGDLVPEAAAK